MAAYPKTDDPVRTRIMKSNRGKNSKPELRLRGALIGSGIGGFRLHWRDIPGTPDISFPREKLAIFVNGCFWHRCPSCKPKLPNTNREFWRKKFIANRKRDKLKIDAIEDMGWKVLVLRECEIENDLEICKNRILQAIT